MSTPRKEVDEHAVHYGPDAAPASSNRLYSNGNPEGRWQRQRPRSALRITFVSKNNSLIKSRFGGSLFALVDAITASLASNGFADCERPNSSRPPAGDFRFAPVFASKQEIQKHSVKEPEEENLYRIFSESIPIAPILVTASEMTAVGGPGPGAAVRNRDGGDCAQRRGDTDDAQRWRSGRRAGP
ncbi:hypothetical protein EVAR_35208_1 [Eumeta japonica]|uniref:Uncharacterized protein n=1 Tax=Eumeta variegata TaxID=151549 RepID=A0A4C1VF98_EUMVA|nr:hypothetical protein EVAR_35208_1 [Eumeta japonica]